MLRLFSVEGTAAPSVRNLSVAYSTSAPKSDLTTGNPGLMEYLTCRSGMLSDGFIRMAVRSGAAPPPPRWCWRYWTGDTGPCEPRCGPRWKGVYDWIYDGHGKLAVQYGLCRHVWSGRLRCTFTSLSQAEEWVAAGVPVVASIAWGKGDLTGSTIPSTGGHLLVIVGFDLAGNPIVE